MALRRYFEAHLAIKLEQVKQSLQRTEGGILVHPQPPYKVSSVLQPFNVDKISIEKWIIPKNLGVNLVVTNKMSFGHHSFLGTTWEVLVLSVTLFFNLFPENLFIYFKLNFMAACSDGVHSFVVSGFSHNGFPEELK